VLAVRHREPFRADRCRDDRFAHRHRFEDLQARSAADSQRYHVDGRLAHVRPHVVDATRDVHAVRACELFDGRRRRAADDRELHVRFFGPDDRQHLATEVQHRVFVREPIHRTGEHQVTRRRIARRWRKEADVDAGRHDGHRRAERVGIQARERVAVRVGHGQYALESRERVPFVAQHPAVLNAIEQARKSTRLGLGMTPPDFGLDVVREDHRRARQRTRQIDRGEEEVADDDVERPLAEQRVEPPPERGRSIFGDGIRQRIGDVPRRIGVETQRSLSGIRSGDRLDSCRDLVHGVDAGSQASVGQHLVGVGEREVGDLVMPREVPQQMPRPQLAALVKRQQEIRF
jgi:hypothetical protein